MRKEKIKVLLVYHSASLSAARKIFEALAAHKEIELRVLGPRRAFNRKRNVLLEIPEPYHGKFDLVTGSVYKAMRDPTGPYLTGLLREMVQFRPQIIHIMNEVFSRLSNRLTARNGTVSAPNHPHYERSVFTHTLTSIGLPQSLLARCQGALFRVRKHS